MGGGAWPRAAGVTGVRLERARATDVSEVAALERTCYADPWPATSFDGLQDNPAVHFVVARQGDGGRLTGYVIGWFVADEGEVANLAVSPESRRNGVGTALLDSLLADAAARGTRALFLEVRESNVAARKLYTSRNFEEVGRRRRYYRSPEEDALILRCTLKR